ncbi:hypothetical protein AGOR_G00225730 [Albula goreensis]|uniref:Ig-like domain-containing protein n=1 Tax=Albula goreensis TaxID=1534307 RepID=A0A8T3CLI5_9TELE|nr:hypothetical protein AGOR_G00225730 [Albula goreensis]
MLGTLCTLITLISCVSGVTVVTQKPPVLTVSKGQTATMDCNLGSVTNDAVRWYKQGHWRQGKMFCMITPVHIQNVRKGHVIKRMSDMSFVN